MAKFDVEKFDGHNNFSIWQCEVLDVLTQQELDGALGKEKPEEIKEEDWKKMNRKACGQIRLFLGKDQKYPFMHETSANKLWTELEDKYMTKSIENRLYLKKKLFRFEYKGGMSMSEHLNNFNKILADLQNLDVKIDDEDKALLLLNSLPDSYEHLVTTLLYGKEEIRYIDVSNTLMNNELRKKDKEGSRDSAVEALTVRGRTEQKKSDSHGRSQSDSHGRSQSRSREESSSRRRLAKDECAFCHNKGHWKKDCPKLKNKDNSDVNFARKEDVEEEAAFLVSSSDSQSNSQSDRWILDSGCSYHMCPNRQWFSSFQELDGGVVLMGNNSACQTKGIGTVRLKMHNGTIRRLTDVRYVPDLKKNLISLGALESSGYKVTMENGILKVVRGALLAMKGIRKGNLYFMDGHAVIGRAVISSSSEDKASKISRPWHMRLRHDREKKALQGLIRQSPLNDAKTRKLDFCKQYVLGKQKKVKFSTDIHCGA